MSEVCVNFDCEYNKPIRKSRSVRGKSTSKKKAKGHCKIGKRKSFIVSGRCMLGSFKRQFVCQ